MQPTVLKSQSTQGYERVTVRNISKDTLDSIQRHFHALIRARAAQLIDRHSIILPELVPLLTVEKKAWFPVPGMCGGFSYWLEDDDHQAKLMVVSWSRVVGGSGRRHEITAAGSRLIEKGFV